MIDIKDRIGKFNITIDAIENNPLDVLIIMSNVIVIRVEGSYTTHTINYIGLSEHFDIVKKGEMIPKYEFILINDG